MRKKLIFGIGFNDCSDTVVHFTDGKRRNCIFYQKWFDMLKRCYSKKYQDKHPSYIGCRVCDDWLSFSKFKQWMKQQDWENNDLDKDLIIKGNKVYSPETCSFVSKSTNLFTLDRARFRGDLPTGVSYKNNNNTFQSKCCNPFTGKREWLGCFSSPEEAHKAWKLRKHQLACILADLQKDYRVANSLRTRYL